MLIGKFFQREAKNKKKIANKIFSARAENIFLLDEKKIVTDKKIFAAAKNFYVTKEK